MDDKKLLGELEEKYQTGEQNKRTAEQNALININFINGKQHIRYNPTRNIVEEIPLENRTNLYREREVFNKIRPLRNKIIKQLKDKIPIPYAIAHSQRDEDIQAAKVTSAVLRDIFEKQRVTKTMKKIITDNIDIGPAFFEVKWNKDAGKVVMSDVESVLGDAQFLFDPDEKKEIAKALSPTGKLKNGDVEINFVKMYELYVSNPYEEEIDSQDWVIKAKAFDVKEAEKHFGCDLTEDAGVGMLTSQRSSTEHGQMLTRNLGVYSTETTAGKVIIKEYYEKPTSLHKKGRYIIFGGGKVLYSGEMPYKNGFHGERTYPFVKVWIPTPGQFYSHAFIEDMKSVQRRYNQVRNRKYEYINKNTNGQLIVEAGSLQNEKTLSNRPGDVIWVKRGFSAPTTMQSSVTGTLDADSEIYSLEQDFVSVTGVSSLSQSGTPENSGIRGANMVNLLLEQDQDRFALVIDSLSDAIIEVAEMVVRIYKQKLLPNEVRYSKYMDDTGAAVNWKKDILTENISIKNRALLATSDSQRKVELQQIMSMGLLSTENNFGPAMTNKILDQFHTGLTLDEIGFKGNADLKKAQRENRLIVFEGAEIKADEIDNHTIHYEIHSDFMKSSEYREMILIDPKIDQRMRKHTIMHKEILDQWQKDVQAEALAKQNNQ